MRKIPAILCAGVAAAAVAGTAVAAGPTTHVMTVALPGGPNVKIEYVGDVEPKVTLDGTRSSSADTWLPLPTFAGLNRVFDELNQQAEAMMREAQQSTSQRFSPSAMPYVASFGGLPASTTSTTIVSYSNGNAVCTRTTETVSQGPGKPPKVTSSVSGNCSGGEANEPAAAKVNRT